MLLAGENLVKVLPILRFELFGQENSFLIQTNLLKKNLTVLKNHFKYQFKMLTCISGLDEPKLLYRFKIVYELLSIQYNNRIRVKCAAAELVPVNSVESIYSSANWWECEIWDMFGVFFNHSSNLVRLLTDYGFEGYPLRKDFPLTGFYESKYNQIKHRVTYGNVELCQEYRTFDFPSPWEN